MTHACIDECLLRGSLGDGSGQPIIAYQWGWEPRLGSPPPAQQNIRKEHDIMTNKQQSIQEVNGFIDMLFCFKRNIFGKVLMNLNIFF